MIIAELPTEISSSPDAQPPRPWPLLLRIGAVIENTVIILCLLLMVILPLAESISRKVFEHGFYWSSSLVQHGTLIVAIIGGAVAARKNRLLALATTTMLPKGRFQNAGKVFAAGIGAAVSVMLMIASIRFAILESEGDKVVAFAIPVWLVQMLILPTGFGLIAIRILWNSSDTWLGRGMSLAVTAAAAVVSGVQSEPSGTMVITALVILLIATVLGMPIFATLGGAALILFWGDQIQIASVPIPMYSLVVNPSLPTIPLFTLAGYVLAEGGASRRLVRLFDALFGGFRGGPAIVTVVVCAFFTSFTGASGVTILALGGLLMPILIGAKYSERAALGLVTGSGSIGMLFPPCLPLLLFAIVAGRAMQNNPAYFDIPEVTFERMFLAGMLPGVLLTVMTAALGIWMGPRKADGPRKNAFNGREAFSALWAAKWELLLPVVVLVSLFGGFANAVEASAITALYAILTQTVIWHDLRIFRDLPRVFVECGLIIGGVLLILSVAQGFTSYLIDAQVPDQAVEWVTASVHSPWVFLLMLNLVLLVIGCLMDVYSAIVVVVPLVIPIAIEYGIDPLHLGIIFLANLELGFLTPPVGMNLFLASYRFNKPVMVVARSIVPILLIQLVGVLVITYVPPITMLLPEWYDQRHKQVAPPEDDLLKQLSDAAGIPPALALAGDGFDRAAADVSQRVWRQRLEATGGAESGILFVGETQPQ